MTAAEAPRISSREARARRLLRRWILVSGVLAGVALLLQLTLVPAIVEAVYSRGTFGPLDFTGLEGTPRRSLEQMQLRIACRVGGLIANVVLSWGLLAAALLPGATLRRAASLAGRRALAAGGLVAAGLGVALFDPTSALGIVGLLLAFAGLVSCGAGLGMGRDASSLGRLVAGAALLTLAVFTLPPLFRDPPTLDSFYKEDTLFEDLQAQLYAVTGLLLLLARRRGPATARLLLLLGGVGFLLVAAEEISWGQRLFSWSTPDFWPNTQGETNLHNMPGVISDNVARVYRLILLGWGGTSLAAAVASPLRRAMDRYGIPVVPLPGVVAMAAALVANSPTTYGWYRNRDEIQETLGALGAVCAGFRTRFGSLGPTPGDAEGQPPEEAGGASLARSP